jgi:phage shock protein PspC (stress-responsive transcriptional regulator)
MKSPPVPNPIAFTRPSRGDGRLALGVCAGLARRWGVDVWLLRVVASFAVITGFGALGYLALAVVMPGPREVAAAAAGGSAAEPGSWRRSFGASLVAALRLMLWLAIALAAAVGASLMAVFGLAWVVLVIAAVLVLITVFVRRPVLAPLPFVAAGLALPAAAFALSDHHIQRTRGVLTVRPAGPADLSTTEYRRGIGDVLVDLRGFHAAARSVTRINARSDLARVVVALPVDRCFNLRVHYRSLYDDNARLTGEALHAAADWQGLWNLGSGNSSLAIYEFQSREEDLRHEEQMRRAGGGSWTTSLIAFNRSYWGSTGTWTRESADPDAPILDLTLTSAAASRVQDYPDRTGPLADGYTQDWPSSIQPPAPPDVYRAAWSRKDHSTANRVRWTEWQDRSAQWAATQAKRFAGACATRADLRARVVRNPTGKPKSAFDGTGREIHTAGDVYSATVSEDYDSLPPRLTPAELAHAERVAAKRAAAATRKATR